jgi:hypothetical protein
MQSRDDKDFEIWAKCQLGIKQVGHNRGWKWRNDWSFSIGTNGIAIGHEKVQKDRCDQCGDICNRLSDKYGRDGADSKRDRCTKIWKAKKPKKPK